MKNKKGFTLIELLAVVVILAVIALISTPLILDIIDSVRKGAFKDTTYGIVEAAKLSYTNEFLKSGQAAPIAFTYVDGIETSSINGRKLNYKGMGPQNGAIIVNNKGEVAIAIHNGKYCAEKTYYEEEVRISKKTVDECQVTETYSEFVNDVLVTAAKTYMDNNSNQLPSILGNIAVTNMDTLKASGLITGIYDSTNPSIECEGYIVTKKMEMTEYTYTPYFKCGDSYETEGYIYQETVTVEYLVVAGGGGGGAVRGGGGGAGGLLTGSKSLSPNDYAVTVGAGGLGGTNETVKGTNGSNSVFGTIVATGGGGGGSRDNADGLNGGSGGGSSSPSGTATGGTGITAQGHNGGSCLIIVSTGGGAGGGGAGEIGQNSTDTTGGQGGDGIQSDITGILKYYAGGGGGGEFSSDIAGLGGLGGGGNGATGTGNTGQSGMASTGSGGGGGSGSSGKGGAGGSGIIIIKYAGPQRANGGMVTTVDGYTVHTFISGTSTLKLLEF